jgi:urease accessory protein
MATRLTHIVGYASDPEIADRLHALGHRGRVEHIDLDRDDTLRHRLRVVSDAGADCAIALPRDQKLAEGAVLLLDDERAIVVRMTEESWLAIAPRDAASALELGYFVGNLHWRVKFANGHMRIALEGPEQDYLDRLLPYLEDGRARRVEDD